MRLRYLLHPNPLKGFILNQIFSSVAKTIQILCNATRINLDPPSFSEQYVSFPLEHWHGIKGDFFIRAQSVGITLKGEDVRLFYLIQDYIQRGEISFEVMLGGLRKPLEPKLSGDGEFNVNNPCTFYLASISSGNLKDCSDIPISRNEATFENRSDFLADLLFTQWIVKMMPIIEMYKVFKRNHLLIDLPTANKEA